MNRQGYIGLALAFPLLASCQSAEASIDRKTAEVVLAANQNAALEVEVALDRVARVCMEDLGFDIHPPELESTERLSIDELLATNVYTRPDTTLPPAEIYGIGLNSGVDTTFVEVDDSGEIHYLEDPGEFDLQPIETQEDYFQAFYGNSEMTPEVLNLPDVGQTDRAAGGVFAKQKMPFRAETILII